MEAIGPAEYQRLTITKNPAATDVQFSVQVNGDLQNAAGWNSVDTVIEQDTSTTLVVRDVIANGPRFIRLHISRSP